MFPRRPEGGGDRRSRVRAAAAVVMRPGSSGSWILIGHRFPDAHLPDLWEFPGGKARKGESGAACARREVREETGVEVAVEGLLLRRAFDYPDRVIDLEFHACRWLGGTPQPLGCRAVRWVLPAALEAYPFPDANGPVLAALARGGWL